MQLPAILRAVKALGHEVGPTAFSRRRDSLMSMSPPAGPEVIGVFQNERIPFGSNGSCPRSRSPIEFEYQYSKPAGAWVCPERKISGVAGSRASQPWLARPPAEVPTERMGVQFRLSLVVPGAAQMSPALSESTAIARVTTRRCPEGWKLHTIVYAGRNSRAPIPLVRPM
jgi:hypothetical protein